MGLDPVRIQDLESEWPIGGQSPLTVLLVARQRRVLIHERVVQEVDRHTPAAEHEGAKLLVKWEPGNAHAAADFHLRERIGPEDFATGFNDNVGSFLGQDESRGVGSRVDKRVRPSFVWECE